MKMPPEPQTIKDLKEINFGQSVPEETLCLLHWFANIVDIDNNNVIWLTFDPANKDFGSHSYYNDEELLKTLPEGQQYYTIGNVRKRRSEELPDYVKKRIKDTRNMSRVIIRVRKESRGTTVHQVYITQHYETCHSEETGYDPEHTYHVSSKLLRQIREFSLERSPTEIRNTFGREIDDSQFQKIKKKWGDLAPLGLFLFIVMPQKNQDRYSNTTQLGFGSNTHLLGSGSNMTTDFGIEIAENAHASNDDCKRNVCIGLGVCFLLIVIIIIIGLLIGRHKK